MCSKINFQSRLAIVSVLILAQCSNPVSAQVSRNQLFPFGLSNEDTVLTPCIRCHSEKIILKFPVYFFDTPYTIVYVNSRGIISFESVMRGLPRSCNSTAEPRYSRIPLIAPLWSDIDTTHGGNIYFRESRNETLISKANEEIQNAFPDLQGILSLKSIFIVTWDKVASYREYPCPDENLRNTFQVILATADEDKSFVIFYYNEITWTKPTQYVNSKCVQHYDIDSAAGFTAGVGHPFHDVLGNCTVPAVHLVTESNVGESGKWVFRVDQGFQHPSIYSRAPMSTSTVAHVLCCCMLGVVLYVSLD